MVLWYYGGVVIWYCGGLGLPVIARYEFNRLIVAIKELAMENLPKDSQYFNNYEQMNNYEQNSSSGPLFGFDGPGFC